MKIFKEETKKKKKNKRRILPLLGMDKLLRKNDANRVSKKAKEELRKELRKYGDKLSSKAVEMCEHDDRKTVMKKDIEMAEEFL